jgi:arylsulfatase
VPLVVRSPGGDNGDRVNEPASLTQFPTIVEETLAGDDASFVPNEPVVVSSHGLEEPMEERASRYAGDLYRFNGDCRAVYEADGETVQKYLSWREKRRRVDIADVFASWLASDTDDGVVNERFSLITDRGVQTDSDSEVDEATQKRLEDLGYM